MAISLSDELRIVLTILAVYRLSRMATTEDGPFDVFLRAREGAAVRDNRIWQAVARLFNCPFCMGVWLAAAGSVAVLTPTPIGDAILIWLALAGAQSFLQSLDRN